jgi:amino-acid N-acetyltransferase
VIRSALRRLTRPLARPFDKTSTAGPASSLSPYSADTSSLMYGAISNALQVTYRKAQPGDQDDIRALVRSERLNPNDLHWQQFVVATFNDHLVGAVQLREHSDGSRELGSFVVANWARQMGIGGRLVSTLLLPHSGAVYLITRGSMARYFKRWGFEPTLAMRVPAQVRRNHVIGSLVSFVFRLLGRPAQKLVVLRRPPVYQSVVVRMPLKSVRSRA